MNNTFEVEENGKTVTYVGTKIILILYIKRLTKMNTMHQSIMLPIIRLF